MIITSSGLSLGLTQVDEELRPKRMNFAPPRPNRMNLFLSGDRIIRTSSSSSLKLF